METEGDPNRALLEEVPLSGQTAATWAEAHTALGQLWMWFTHLQDTLARVDEVRGKRWKLDRTRFQELEGLLIGPSIELTIDEVPASRRDDAGTGAASIRYTAAELADVMSTTPAPPRALPPHR